MKWLPCHFTDEKVFLNKLGHTKTQPIHREVMLQFGQKGDDPVNPHAVTFLVTGESCRLLPNINNTEHCSVLLYSTVFCSVVGSKLDLRDYVEGVDADQLDCELRRYSTEGIHCPLACPGSQRVQPLVQLHPQTQQGPVHCH